MFRSLTEDLTPEQKIAQCLFSQLLPPLCENWISTALVDRQEKVLASNGDRKSIVPFGSNFQKIQLPMPDLAMQRLRELIAGTADIPFRHTEGTVVFEAQRYGSVTLIVRKETSSAQIRVDKINDQITALLSCNEPIVIIDMRGVVIDANRALCLLFKLLYNQVTHHKLDTVLNAKNRSLDLIGTRFRCTLAAQRNGIENIEAEFFPLEIFGQNMYVVVFSVEQFVLPPAINSYQGVEHLLEEEVAVVYTSLSQPNRDGRITFASDGFLKKFRWTREQTNAHLFFDKNVHPVDSTVLFSLEQTEYGGSRWSLLPHERAFEGQQFSRSFRFADADGLYHVVHEVLTVVSIDTELPTGCFGPKFLSNTDSLRKTMQTVGLWKVTHGPA